MSRHRFRYVEDPESCALLVDDAVVCDGCGKTSYEAFKGSLFSSRRVLQAVCLNCLITGLPSDIRMARGGDVDALRAQLRERFPSASAEELDESVAEKVHELERQTPPVISWQEWRWPACCGDFCRFLTHAGKPNLDEFARRRGFADGRTLLMVSLVERLKNDEKLWDSLPAEHVFAESNHSPQAYVFQCLTCAMLRITWDAH